MIRLVSTLALLLLLSLAVAVVASGGATQHNNQTYAQSQGPKWHLVGDDLEAIDVNAFTTCYRSPNGQWHTLSCVAHS